VHGDAAAEQAVQTSAALFGGTRRNSVPVGAVSVDDTPSSRISRSEFGDGLPLVELLVRAGLASSRSDARRGIQGRGYYVNEVQVADTDVDRRLSSEDLQPREKDSFILLRKGKKNYVKLVLEP
jgi:tyrosyl-tRNA synthetase